VSGKRASTCRTRPPGRAGREVGPGIDPGRETGTLTGGYLAQGSRSLASSLTLVDRVRGALC